MIYPNSGSVNPLIVIEHNTRQLPVMNSNVTEAPGNLERGDRGATVTTAIAGTEQKTRSGYRDTQILRTHVKSEEVEETSREYTTPRFGPQSCSEEMEPTRLAILDKEEPLDEPDDSFTKLLAELCLEIEEETDIGFEDALEVVSSNHEDSLHHLHWPSTVGCEEADEPPRDREDVRTDHPTSMLGEGRIPVPAMFGNQEVPEEKAEP